MKKNNRKIRYAVLGLGHISQSSMLPAFAHAKGNSELVALISEDPTKLKKLAKKYKIENVYSYSEYQDCLKSGYVDAVYIALPNNMHCEYMIRAAEAGVHVLCEKPMAVTVGECERMLAAAEDHKIKLMIAYRLHFEEANLKAIELAKKNKLGDLRIFSSNFTMQVKKGNIRLQKALGGGTLYDIGIYCINAARYLFRDEPEEVFAFSTQGKDERFQEVDEMTSATLKFPDGRLTQFVCSFGASDSASYDLIGTKARLRLDPSYEIAEALTHYFTKDSRTQKTKYAKRDQFAAELVYFSDCILKNRQPEPSGLEGLKDVYIIEALLESAQSGKAVTLDLSKRSRYASPNQEIQRPPIQKVEDLVHVEAPHA